MFQTSVIDVVLRVKFEAVLFCVLVLASSERLVVLEGIVSKNPSLVICHFFRVTVTNNKFLLSIIHLFNVLDFDKVLILFCLWVL